VTAPHPRVSTKLVHEARVGSLLLVGVAVVLIAG
jgi:hypothetical protein